MFRSSLFLGLLSTVVISCSEEANPLSQEATANFTESTLIVVENGGEQIVSLHLDIPAIADGDLVLTTNTSAPSSFVTQPADQSNEIKISIQKGQSSAAFKIIPVDNSKLDGCKVIKFTITSVPDGMRAGVMQELVVMVNDDEAPVDANFEVSSLNIHEDDLNPAKVRILLAAPAPADGVLVLQVQSTSKYNQEYSTQPAAVTDKIFLEVSKGATSVEVDLYPINDQQFKADRSIGIRIIGVTGGVAIGSKDSFWCTITEDDGKKLSPISMIRSMYTGDVFIILDDMFIEGIVTSSSIISPTRIVVEDATGAIQIQLNTANSLTRGDVALINLNYGLVRVVQGVLEVSQIADFQKLGKETLQIDPMSIGELRATGSEIQSRTVQIGGAFSQADGILTFLGDRLLSDGTNDIIVRTSAFADFGDQAIPEGLVNVTGVVVNIDGTYFLYPQQREDIKKQQFMPIRHL
jgi:hypothetical protein